MCITPEHFPANSFIVMVLEKMEEKIGHDGSNYEINFSRSKSHMPHKAHFPKNIDVSDALGRVLMTINMIYGTKDEDEECFVFDKNKDTVDYAAKSLIALTQLLIKKNDRSLRYLKIPKTSDFKLRIYHNILDGIINNFIDYLIGNKKALFNFKQRVKILEEEVEEFVVLNVSPKEFFNIKPN